MAISGRVKKMRTILAFHVGRGGQFYNPGYVKFIGSCNGIEDFTDDLHIIRENEYELFDTIAGRENLENKFYQCQDTGDWSFFEKLGFDIGQEVYVDQVGNPVDLTVSQAATGIGRINNDYDYDSTYTCYLEDLDKEDLLAILYSEPWTINEYIKEYFKDLNVDWSRVEWSRVKDMIKDHFEAPLSADELENYYEEE